MGSLRFPIPVERLGVDQSGAVLIAGLGDVEIPADVERAPPRGSERALTASVPRADQALTTGLYLAHGVVTPPAAAVAVGSR
ncbi:MAG TPA: hypothetical protein VME46_09315 [Acidimicrobiales bacterium]|nr:hypothetical protein [Acidimicrobiales bacterium]